MIADPYPYTHPDPNQVRNTFVLLLYYTLNLRIQSKIVVDRPGVVAGPWNFLGSLGGTPVSCGVRIFYGGPRDPINKSMPPWVPPFTVHTADICGSEVLANWAARGWPRGLVILRKHTVKHRRRQKKIKIGALARSKISSFKKNRVFRLQKNVFSSFYWSKWFFSSLNCIGIYVSISRRDRLSLASVH